MPGAPAKAALTGRLVSAYSCSPAQPEHQGELLAPAEIEAPAQLGADGQRSELVVCCATLRLSELAPISVKAFCVTLSACKRANGVRLACAGA